MPEPGLARTLVEAYVYLDLAGGSRGARTDEVADGWLVRLGDVEVLVPRESEAWAREQDLTFGAGLSELIDPGQWVLVATTYARRALEGALFFAADPSDAGTFDEVASGWRFAADAVEEALKFFPDGAAELDPGDFWTETGRALRESEPERLTRDKLESDLASYRGHLEDFRRLHGR
ncbi:hypothetical protein OUY22_33310 [Nonomuraea sp. MCN248]|uniref:Uncharacterized protein n=1 Tax=Nonomuraea corallina TaxID=2989783 RepID=A0ABT4SM43_9ACTN|nr:hypothetical protein [Nonomuraea corallina]MDA0638311.1 hypothetical protein [Nonomuraea corallina]